MSEREKLERLTDALVEDIMALSDEELRAEIIEDGGDPDQIAAEVKAIIDKVLAEYRGRNP